MRVHLPALPEHRVRVVTSPLTLLPPIATEAWAEARLRDGDFVVERLFETVTSLGWPALAAHGRQGELPMWRLFVRFLDHGALLEAQGDREGLEHIWPFLLEARPDWTGEPATLSALLG